MSQEQKKGEITIKTGNNDLTADLFQTNDQGNLIIKNQELSNLIQSNIPKKDKQHAAVAVGIIVSFPS